MGDPANQRNPETMEAAGFVLPYSNRIFIPEINKLNKETIRGSDKWRVV